jgi:hypothetical protein
MNIFSSQQLQELRAIREKSGVGTQNPYHAQCPFPGQEPASEQNIHNVSEKATLNNSTDMESLVDIITQVVISAIR